MQTYLQQRTPATFPYRIPDACVKASAGIQEENKISNHLELLVIQKRITMISR